MTREVRIERLLPDIIAAAAAARSVVYLPLGTYEWHGRHLPIGLDALTAHGVCRRAAGRDGGLVCPPLYYGTGGGHSRYPWTVMMDDDSAIGIMLTTTMHRMEDFGIRGLVLFSGHFAPAQLSMIRRLAEAWNRGGSAMSVLSLAVNMAPALALAPDHAAVFETTLLHALHPDLVQIDRLPAATSSEPSDDDPFGAQRHDPAHSLYGIFGPDPRGFEPARSAALLDGMVDWLVGQVRAAMPA